MIRFVSPGPPDVLFSGEESLPTLVRDASTYTVGALVLLIVCKGLAYGISLGSFRGGPVFPSIFIGGMAHREKTATCDIDGEQLSLF